MADGSRAETNGGKSLLPTIMFATMIGVMMNFLSLSPIKALFWSAVLNGIVAVPVMAIMMFITANPKIMGKFPVSGFLKIVGWAATVVMAAAVAGKASMG